MPRRTGVIKYICLFRLGRHPGQRTELWRCSMKIDDFKLEVYFDKYEFTAPYLLTQSDCEAMTIGELLEMEPGAEGRLMSTWLGYTEVAGNPKLRELTAALYTRMTPDDILMHTGAQEAIFAYMNVLLSRGDHMISMFPIYQSIYEVANAESIDVSMWQLHNEGDKWNADFDELEKLIRPNTKLIAINTPNNPTGYTLSEQEIIKLCEIADKRGIYVFADEVYRGLDLDGVKKPWVADVYDRAVSLGVMSKAYGLAGLRIGWLAGRDRELLAKVKKFKHYMSICNSAASETLTEVALKNSDKLLKRNIDIIKGNLAIADEFFGKYGKLFVNNRPVCGPIAFHKMNGSISMEDFCETLVQKSGVLLLPSSIYGMTGPFFRMGYGRKSFEKALGVFEQYLLSEGLV